MKAAWSATSRVHQELDEMERRSHELRETVATLEQELDRASRELGFPRSIAEPAAENPGTAPPPPPRDPPAHDPLGAPSTEGVPGSLRRPTEGIPPPPNGRFGQFTVGR
ncbi:MAG TPA: hypothetical protein VLY85_04195, partial [Thermoplasmata archaeon]|nr:hypothetical protein [Thermoplasmata archaeon]